MTKFETTAQILKVSAELGLIFGFAAICKVDGEDFYDADNEHYPEEAMLRDTTEFAKSRRVACTMHERDADGGGNRQGARHHDAPNWAPGRPGPRQSCNHREGPKRRISRVLDRRRHC